MRILNTPDQINSAVGTSLGTGEWLVIEQERINHFAEATGDHQWIHVDADRAAQGPFGATIAHGYLTLSLIPTLGAGVFALSHDGPTINYGVNKVRFITPVRVGSRIRAHLHLTSATQVRAGLQLLIDYTIEIDGEPKPACVAQTVVLLLGCRTDTAG